MASKTALVIYSGTIQQLAALDTLSVGAMTVTGLTNSSVLFAGTGGALSQNTTNLVWDDTAGTLKVLNGTTADQLRLGTAANYYSLGRNIATGGLDITGTQTGYTGLTINGPLVVGGTDISSSFYLDIIQSSSAAAGFRITNGTTGALAQIQNQLRNDVGSLAYFGLTSSGYTGFAPTAGGQAFWLSYLCDAVFGSQSGNAIRFTQAGAEVARFDTAGKLGIGNTSPASTLDLSAGTAQEIRLGVPNDPRTLLLGTSQRASAAHLLIGRNLHGDPAVTDAYKAVFATSGAVTGYGGIEFGFAGDTNFFASNEAVTANGTVTPASRLLIQGSTGNIGVGKVPATLLDVNGTVTATAVLIPATTGATLTVSSTTDSTTTATGSVLLSGGIGVAGSITIGGWYRGGGGSARLTANVTNATTTVASLSGLSTTLVAGRKYCGRMVLKVNNSTATGGIKIDLGGGSATMTSFWAVAAPAGTAGSGGTIATGTMVTTAIATAMNYTTITGETLITVEMSMVVNVGGTFIPRVATNSAGTVTAELGSYLWLEDMPA